MTPRKLHAQPLYLEPEKAELLSELAANTRIPKAVISTVGGLTKQT